MPVVHFTDHVTAGLGLLIEQYRNKPRIEGLLASYLNRVQELEDAIWSVIIGRLIDYAVGVQLDALGRLVGQVRNGATDEPFRSRIRARIRANRSLAHPDDIIAVAILATDFAPADVTYTEYAADFAVDLLSSVAPDVAIAVHELLMLAKPVGVGMLLTYSEYDDSETFTFATGDSPEADTARGFTDDEDPTDAPGGRWIGSL